MTVKIETKMTVTVETEDFADLVVTVDSDGDFAFEQDDAVMYVKRGDLVDLLDGLEAMYNGSEKR